MSIHVEMGFGCNTTQATIPWRIMPVSRQVYNEARDVFYTLNKFTFSSPAVLSVFLIGIGPRNVMLLRSVWQKTERHEWENVIPTIRQCLPPTMSNAMTPDQKVAPRHAELNRSLLIIRTVAVA
ncbi:unnamed protein product [Penicillium palitans]